jgi:hypothetical protein
LMTCQSLLFGVGEGFAAGVAEGLAGDFAEDLDEALDFANEPDASESERTPARRKEKNRGAVISYKGAG